VAALRVCATPINRAGQHITRRTQLAARRPFSVASQSLLASRHRTSHLSWLTILVLRRPDAVTWMFSVRES
jgi:hypothetical protein